MATVEQEPDRQSHDWASEGKARCDHEAVSNDASSVGGVREPPLVSPPPLEQRRGLLIEPLPVDHALQGECVTVDGDQ